MDKSECERILGKKFNREQFRKNRKKIEEEAIKIQKFNNFKENNNDDIISENILYQDLEKNDINKIKINEDGDIKISREVIISPNNNNIKHKEKNDINDNDWLPEDELSIIDESDLHKMDNQ